MNLVFETPSLILRQFTLADAPLILQLNSDPEIVKYVHEPVLETAAQARKIIADIILPQYRNNLGRWAIHKKDNNEFVGWCGLKYVVARDEIDLGYRLIQSAWGKGLATEAAMHTLEYGFNLLNLQLIKSDSYSTLRIQ